MHLVFIKDIYYTHVVYMYCGAPMLYCGGALCAFCMRAIYVGMQHQD